MTLRYLSVCSGIEAATQAWHALGWQPVAFSEIEKFPSAVLAHHYPATPNWGDMTKFQEWPDADLDVLCGGTPCQSFSVAGLRQGLADPRGNLMLTFGGIAARYRPRWLCWENVPGVLSSEGGRDFASLLGLLTGQQIDVPEGGWGNSGIVPGIADAYGIAWRVLDAQYVRTRRSRRAVPQRRRRVFVVGYLGDWRRAAAVLFDAESLRRDPPPRREAGQGTAAATAPSLTGSGRGVERAGESRGQDPVIAVANSGDVGYCLTASAQQSLDAETETLVLQVAPTLRGRGFDASDDGIGKGTPIIPIDMRQASRGATMTNNRAEGSSGGAPGTGIGEVGDPAPSLGTSNVPAIAGPVCFDSKGSQVQTDETGAAPTLRAMTHADSHQNGGGQVAVAFDMRGREGGAQLEGPHDTANLRASDGGSSRSYVAQPWAVRRLTPVECERLMDFPDGFTAIPWRKKPASVCPDGPRYKALGNSWAVNVAEWVGDRIAEVDAWPGNETRAARPTNGDPHAQP